MDSNQGAAVLLSSALALIIYIGSPYWAKYRMDAAASAHDAETFASYMDMPAIRDRMRSQVSTMLDDGSGSVRGGNPFGGLGASMLGGLSTKLTDEMSSPERLMQLYQEGQFRPRLNEVAHRATLTSSYDPPNTMKLTSVSGTGLRSAAFILEREGLLSWRVRQITIHVGEADSERPTRSTASDPRTEVPAAPSSTANFQAAVAPPTDDDTAELSCRGAQPKKVTPSLDGGFLYEQLCRAPTTDVIVQVRRSDGQRRDVTFGNSLAVIRDGPWRGMLLVSRHKYYTGGGSYDATWIIRPDGKEMLEVPGTESGDEGQVAAWLRFNGWTAN